MWKRHPAASIRGWKPQPPDSTTGYATGSSRNTQLFHDRPFIWLIWDGRKRYGFHALIIYPRLCGSGILPLASDSAAGSRSHPGSHPGRRLLENLTYAYLGEWITRQKDGVKRGEGGADDRLAAAIELQKRLEAILAGEPPFDIFVRWKKLSEFPSAGADINDGVRMNIRLHASDLPGGPKGRHPALQAQRQVDERP